MENDANDSVGVRQRVRYGKTIFTAVTVSLLGIQNNANIISFHAVFHDITDTSNLQEWVKHRHMVQITNVVVGTLAYVLFAFRFERWRRKIFLYLVCISQLITSVLVLTANSHWLLYVSRASSAVSYVGAQMFCVIYVSEIAPDEIRGALVAIHTLLFNSLQILPSIISLLGFQVTFLPYSCISIAICVLVSIWNYVGVPESPIYLLRKEDIAGAKQSLEFLHGTGTHVSGMIVNRKKILKATRSDSQTTTSIFQECISRRAIKFCCIAIALYFLRIIAIFCRTRSELQVLMWEIGKKNSFFDFFQIINNSVAILSNLLVVTLCDRVGRKVLLLSSALAYSITTVAWGIICFLELHYDNEIYSRIRIVTIVLSIAINISVNLGPQILPEVFVADIFPSKILNTQLAILGFIQLCVEYFLYFQIYTLWETAVKQYVFSWLFGGLSCIIVFFVIKFLSEAKGRPPGFMFMDTEESVLYSSLQDEEE